MRSDVRTQYYEYNMISPVDSTIVAMTIQATLTGVYLVTFLLCLRWLIFSDDGLTMRKDIKWPMFIVTIVIFAFSVIDFVFSLKYVLLDLDSCKKRMLYAGIITNIVESLTAIIIDSVLIFRCWMIYNRSFRIAALPSLLLLYNISAVLLGSYWGILASEKCQLASSHLRISHVSFMVCTIVINIYATTAIIARIWKNSISPWLILFFTRLFAESGLLYTITSIVVVFTAFIRPSQGSDLPLLISTAINFPAAGIAYNLILIRAAKNRANPKVEYISLKVMTPVTTGRDELVRVADRDLERSTT